jgi:hypothetical protein
MLEAGNPSVPALETVLMEEGVSWLVQIQSRRSVGKTVV